MKKYIHITLNALALLAALIMAMLAWSAKVEVNRLAMYTTQLRVENRHLHAVVDGLNRELAECYNININEETHTDNAHD